MLKSILIPIQPQWCEKIASGKKTVEVRKTIPKTEPPFKCYIYCTKDKNSPIRLYECENGNFFSNGKTYRAFVPGKVIGEFICDRFIDVDCDSVDLFDHDTLEYLNDKTCLTRDELWAYTHGYRAWGWNITNLKMYDEAKDLSDFGLKRAPQSWVYVEK